MKRVKCMKSNVIQDKLFMIVVYAFLIIFSIAAVFPFISIFSSSITNEKYLMYNGFSMIPHDITLTAYEYIFSGDSAIAKGYLITLTVTVTGTIISMLVTSMLAYAISRKELKYGRQLSFFVYMTMLFNGGLVPWYIILTNYLHLSDNIWALIFPYTVNAWNLFLLLNFFKTIDVAMLESARIDGANEFRILFRIVLPLMLPGVVTISLFYALQYWNDWFLSLMLINRRQLYPLQYLLKMILSTVEYVSTGGTGAKYAKAQMPTESLKMATTIVTIGPIIFLYPFTQRFFIKGLTLGGVKG